MFFFSSRRRHTRWPRDWSSDVCSSDLDGSEEKFETRKIINAIFEILTGLEIEDDYEIVFQIMKELELKVPERVKTEEIDLLLLKAIEQLIPGHPMFDTLATRQLLKQIHKTIGRRLGGFREYLEMAVDQGLVKEELLEFDLDLIEAAIDEERDHLFGYFGFTTLRDRYLMRDRYRKSIA